MVIAIGHKRWTIAEGYIPGPSGRLNRQPVSHETASILNPEGQDAHVQIMIYFADREPVGPYQLTIPAQRTKLIQFSELIDPAPIPKDIEFTSAFESNVPIVVQHFRLDSGQTETALVSTMASPVPDS